MPVSKKSQKMKKIQRATMMTKKTQRVRATSARSATKRAVMSLTTQSYLKLAKTGMKWRKKPSKKTVKQLSIATPETSNVEAHLVDTKLNLADVDEVMLVKTTHTVW